MASITTVVSRSYSEYRLSLSTSGNMDDSIDTGSAPPLNTTGRVLARVGPFWANPLNPDHANHFTLPMEFSRLGFSPIMATSAEHGLGVPELVDRIDALLPAPPRGEAVKPEPVKVAIVGRPNVGKSSITNAILQDERTLV